METCHWLDYIDVNKKFSWVSMYTPALFIVTDYKTAMKI